MGAREGHIGRWHGVSPADVLVPEKRKVGGSTPPLTTTSEQRKRCCRSSLFRGLVNGFANRRRDRLCDRLGEDVTDTCRVLAEDVGVDAQGHGGVGMAEAGGHDVNGNS